MTILGRSGDGEKYCDLVRIGRQSGGAFLRVMRQVGILSLFFVFSGPMRYGICLPVCLQCVYSVMSSKRVCG